LAEVFIGYRREDQGDAGRMYELLASYFGPERVFIDTATIRPGDPFPATIAAAIRDCKVLVALITPHWHLGLDAEDDWVRRELEEAIAAGRPIVPLLMHGNPAPRRGELPAQLAELADLHALALSDADFRGDMARLIRALESRGAEPAPRLALVEIPKAAKVEARAAWDSLDAPAEARHRLDAVLDARNIQVSGEDGDTLLLRGGDRWQAFTKGMGIVSELLLPLKGRLRIRDAGAVVSIEVLLEEDAAFGLLAGSRRRFVNSFDETIDALRRATQRR
jgi:TIR domain-containing protein